MNYKNITVLDFENTFQVKDKKKDPSPYNIDNYLVSYGVWHQDQILYKCFRHNDKEADPDAFSILQNTLDNTDLLIAFNTKYELSWLKACGFIYDGLVFDPMLACYVLARGQKLPLSLADCCIRFNVEEKKSELVDKYLKNNIGFEEIPWDIVEEYGIGDVNSTLQLYHVVVAELNKHKHLWPTVNLMNQFCICLTDIETNGIKIDVEALDSLEKEYTKELNTLNIELQVLIKEVMGCTPINLESPEHLSRVLYSRRVIDKKAWKEVFNLGTELRGSVIKPKRRPKMSTYEFVNNVKKYTQIIYKTTTVQCQECRGTGKIQRIKVDGLPFAKQSTCSICRQSGIIYIPTKEIAGFKLIPSSAEETAIGGFSTNGEVLERLLLNAKGDAREFLTKYKRANQISTYISTFVMGIKRGIDASTNSIIHTSFMQHVTATGRLSSQRPNYQNMPRAQGFEVRRVVVSRFENGLITEADAKQLEFRVAAILSKNTQMREDIINNIDVHSVTAEVIGCSRQDAKPATFAPLYGAVPQGKPERIAKYYSHFIEKYGLNEWHSQMASDIIANGGYQILPSGREFYFKDTKRYNNGSFSNATQIKNYCCQSFATGDIIPVFCIEVWKLIKQYNFKSIPILTVHDSIVIDTVYEERDSIKELLYRAWDNTVNLEMKSRWNFSTDIPLEIEIKQGMNWLNLK